MALLSYQGVDPGVPPKWWYVATKVVLKIQKPRGFSTLGSLEFYGDFTKKDGDGIDKMKMNDFKRSPFENLLETMVCTNYINNIFFAWMFRIFTQGVVEYRDTNYWWNAAWCLDLGQHGGWNHP